MSTAGWQECICPGVPSLGVLSLKQWANPCSYGCFIFREFCRERFFTGLAIRCNQSRNDFVRLQSIVLPSNVDTNETEGSLVLASWLHLFIFHWFAPLWIGLGWNVRPLWQDGPPWPCLMDDKPRKCLPCPSMSRLLFRVLWWHWILIRRGRVARQVSRSGRFIRPSEMYIPHACLLLMLQSRNKSEAVCAVLFPSVLQWHNPACHLTCSVFCLTEIKVYQKNPQPPCSCCKCTNPASLCQWMLKPT